MIAIPELHDRVFGPTPQDHPVAPLPHTAIPPLRPGKADLDKDVLRTRGETLLSDALSLSLAGQNDRARADYNDAHTLSQQIGDKRGEANALRGLGDLERHLGRNDQARRL